MRNIDHNALRRAVGCFESTRSLPAHYPLITHSLPAHCRRYPGVTPALPRRYPGVTRALSAHYPLATRVMLIQDQRATLLIHHFSIT